MKSVQTPRRLIDIWEDCDFFQILYEHAETWFPEFTIDWNYSPETLDLTYFNSFSGLKPASLMLRRMTYKSETPTLIDADRVTLVKTVYDLYKRKWKKLYETLSYDYDPISNYDMEETMDKETSHSEDFTHGHGIATEGTGQLNTFGFNSTDVDGNPTNKTLATGSETHSGTDEKSGGGTEEYTLTRKGNIGTMTSQQMVQSERDLNMWDYFRQVFSDIDTILTLPIY